MTHSQMVQTRRRKQAGKKTLARVAKLAKKTKDSAAAVTSAGPSQAVPGGLDRGV